MRLQLARCTLSVFITLGSPVLVFTKPLPQPLSIQQAVQLALQNNPDNSIAQYRISQAKATAAMMNSYDYPLINLSGEYGQTNNPMYSFGNILNQGEFDETIDFNDPGRTDNLQLKAEITYRIYNGGQTRAGKIGAEAKVDASKSDIQRVHQHLSFEVVKSYHGVIQAKKMVDVRKQALTSISAAYDVGKARYDAGDLLLQDVLNLEVQQSRAKEDLIVSSHNLELSKQTLLNLLGKKEGQLTLDENGTTDQLPPDNPNYLKRNELTTLLNLKNAALADLEKARGINRPKIDTFASYQFDNGWELDGNGDSWMAGLRVNYNLYDGKNTESRISIARIKVQEIEARIQKTELALSLELQQALLSYQQMKERLGVTQKMVGVSQEAARLARIRFKEGVILSSDLIDFETRLSDAQARHLSASAHYQIAIANLRRATGLDQFSL